MHRRSLAAAALALLAPAAWADVDASAQFGFDGRWVVDAATPLVLTLSNTGTEPVRLDIRVTLGAQMGRSDQEHIRRIDHLAAGVSRAETFIVPGPPRFGGGVNVELRVAPTVPMHFGPKSGDRGMLTFEVTGESGFNNDSIPYTTCVLGVSGDERGAIAARVRALLAPEVNGQSTEGVALEVLSVQRPLLRLAPLAFDGLNAFVALDPDERFAASPDEVDALLDWVALGGGLVVSLGEHAAQFAASPLSREMPASWTGSGHASYVEVLAGAGTMDPGRATTRGPWVSLRPNEFAHGKEHPDSPASVERRLGMGRIVLLAYDLRTAAMTPWLDAKGLRFVLEPVVKLPTPPEADQNQWNHVDFSTAIARTLQAGAFTPPPLPLVVLGIVLYVVVVGPLDWFVLKRLRKERLTTLTFAGAVAAFTLLAYGASMLLFSAGARVNRVVIADLAEAGRDGRQAFQFQDIAGYYSPVGSDQDVDYPLPCAVLGSIIPGSQGAGELGSTMPVVVGSADPLHPRAIVQLAFRSQRVLRAHAAGTLGATIDVAFEGKGPELSATVTNGLAVDLDRVLVFRDADYVCDIGHVPAGGTSSPVHVKRRSDCPVATWAPFTHQMWGDSAPPTPAQVESLLESISLGRILGHQDEQSRPSADDLAALLKAGLDRSEVFARGNALVVAFARSFVVALPGSDTVGDTYVVLRKEVPLP